MQTGISFEFNYQIDLQFAEAFMDFVFPKTFASGGVNVMLGDDFLGAAGQITTETMKTIPQGSKLSLVTDLNDDQRSILSKEVSEANAAIDRRYKTLTVIPAPHQ